MINKWLHQHLLQLTELFPDKLSFFIFVNELLAIMESGFINPLSILPNIFLDKRLKISSIFSPVNALHSKCKMSLII